MDLRYNPHWVRFLHLPDVEPGILAGFHAMQAMLAEGSPPTALLATNDLVAMGVIEALKLAGLDVPGQISVIGYDDLGRDQLPPLTTIQSYPEEVGRVAAAVLRGRQGRPPVGRRRQRIHRLPTGLGADDSGLLPPGDGSAAAGIRGKAAQLWRAASAGDHRRRADSGDGPLCRTRRSGRIAAIMMEPVLCNSGCLLPEPGYLEGVRELATRHGCLLVFDEVITGFRINPGGAQKHFRVTPDLASFGKAVGGGVPLSVIAGRAEIMEQMFSGGVAFGGTFNGNPLSLAGASACLDELSRDDGSALCHANRMREILMRGIGDLARRHGVALQVTGFGAAFYLHFTGLPWE